MANQRIKGQEVEIDVIQDGVVLETLNDIRSFEIAALNEILTEGYLGEKTDRRDEIFRGARGSTEVHFETREVFDLVKAVIDRSTKRDPGAIINIRATLNFDDGNNRQILLRNVFFGEFPIAFASRSDYGTLRLDFEGSDIEFI